MNTTQANHTASIPARAGIGLRAPHYREILSRLPDLGWFEVASENYFGDGGQPLYYLERIRKHYALSFHGVGMSLGSVAGLSREHLRKLKSLVQRFEPGLVSDHLCWGESGGRYLNDLLPLPYTEEALQVVCGNVHEAQDFLQRQILVENVSSYLQFKHSTMPEWEFLREVAARTGCGMLLDVNNIYVSATNHGFDAMRYLRGISVTSVWEMHLAGFDSNGTTLIDTHGKPVADAVWALYRQAVLRFGAIPTLIEWDTDIPALDVLLTEVGKADNILDERDALAA
jgi:uncharacterized protein (UPF0276 family)